MILLSHLQRHLRRVLLVGLIVAPGPLLQNAAAAPVWTGTWQTEWRGGGAILHLRQDGDTVTGTYPLYDGAVEGKITGRNLDGRWSEASGRSGGLVFSLSPEGDDFMGRFDSGEWWTGRRLSDSHEFEAPATDRSSPREALRAFVTAANAARAGFIEQIRPGLESIDFSNPAWRSEAPDIRPPRPQERLDYARKLFMLLDELTFRVWDIPGATGAAPADDTRVMVSLKQAGTAYAFDLWFVRQGATWMIEPPAPTVLDAALEKLYERRGGTPPTAREHLLLRTPRATMRTFLEELRNFDSGGREKVERTMDLENLGVIRQDDSRLLADYLKHIIDRVGFVIYQEIPNDADQDDTYIHFRHGAGIIEIGPFELADGRTEWRFTANTLRSLRHLYAAMDGMPEVAGVTEITHLSAFFAVRGWLRHHAPWLLHRLGPIERWQWLSIGAFLLTSILLAFVATALILFVLRRRGSWAEAVANGRLRLALVWPLRITFIGVFWYLKVGTLGLPESVSAPVRSIAASMAIGSGVWLAYRGLGLAGEVSNRTIGTAGQTAIFTSLSLGMLRIIVVVAGALLLANAWSLPYSSVLAGLGVGGLALALAAKETVQNMIAGFTLFADSPLSVGDFCRYGDKLGTVEQIGLRSTRIRSRDRTLVSIPNSEFANLQLENFAKRDRILLQTTLGLRYETSPDQLRFVLAQLRHLLIAHPKVDPEPARVRFVGFGAYSVDIEIYAYVLTPEWNEFLGIREDLFLRLMQIIEESGTQFAFPTQVNYLARDSGTDAGLTRQAEEAVARWRNENQLPFPDFDPARVAAIANQLDYPPQGSCSLPPAPGKPVADSLEEGQAP